MSKYTKNQIEHAKQQVQLLLSSRGMTRKQLSFELGYGSDAVTSLNAQGKKTGNLTVVRSEE